MAEMKCYVYELTWAIRVAVFHTEVKQYWCHDFLSVRRSSGCVALCRHTVDGRNPAPVVMVVYPIIYSASYMLGGAGFLPSTVLGILLIFQMSAVIV